MLGRGLLVVAGGFAVYAAVAAPFSVRGRPELLASARRALVASAVALAGSAGVLWFALFTRDFSIAYVAETTSRAAQPWYTFSALWAGMSGSLLLWCLILSAFAAFFAGRHRPEAEAFLPWAIPVLGGTIAFFVAITAGPENPFRTLDVVPPDGRGMNPLLHSPGMVIHPPMLYAGFTGLAVPFSVAVAALITRRTGADWLRVVRHWMLVPWLFLGVGLVLGGGWAYTELGWGGYWGWDPVENAALMPWLAATAFLHSAVVQERRGMLKVWNIFLVTLAFDLAVFGTFLTRSGLLSSVHAFAESPIGKWFFVFLGVVTALGLGLLAWRLPDLRTEHRLDAGVSKEAGFLVNNLLFLGVVLVVFWGTVLPLVTEAVSGRQLSVGPPFFNRVVSPLGALLLLLAAIAPVLPWRRGSVGSIVRRLARPAVAATVAGIVALAVTRVPAFAGLVWLASFLAAVSVLEVLRPARARATATAQGVWTSVKRLTSGNPRRYGGYLVHIGIAVMVVGFAGSLFKTQADVVVSPGERFSFAGYRFDYLEFDRYRAPDKLVNLAVLDVSRSGRRVATMRPQLNIHENWDQTQAEIAIRTTPREDLYVILAGSGDGDGEVVFRLYRNPLVFWVWAGSVLAVGGALVALFARRRSGSGVMDDGATPAPLEEARA